MRKLFIILFIVANYSSIAQKIEYSGEMIKVSMIMGGKAISWKGIEKEKFQIIWDKDNDKVFINGNGETEEIIEINGREYVSGVIFYKGNYIIKSKEFSKDIEVSCQIIFKDEAVVTERGGLMTEYYKYNSTTWGEKID